MFQYEEADWDGAENPRVFEDAAYNVWLRLRVDFVSWMGEVQIRII